MSSPDAPSQNLANAMAGFDAFNRGDLEESVKSMHPDVEWHIAFRLPDLPADKEIYNGRGEVLSLWRAFRSVWESITINIEEIVWEGEDVAVLRARFVGKGEGSGIQVDRVLFYVVELTGHLLRRMRTFDTEAEARKAAGAPDG